MYLDCVCLREHDFPPEVCYQHVFMDVSIYIYIYICQYVCMFVFEWWRHLDVFDQAEAIQTGKKRHKSNSAVNKILYNMLNV